MRINRYLSLCGLASRRDSEQFILDGRIRVNGTVLQDLSYRVREGDLVECDGRPLKPVLDYRYYSFHKPRYVLSSHSDPHHDRFIYDYLPKDRMLFSAGRLDYDSEGLMVISDDGEFINRLAHPSREVEKEYVVLLDRPVEAAILAPLSEGVNYRGEFYQINQVSYLQKGDFSLEKVLPDWKEEDYEPNRLLRICIHEGKKREVKRIFESIGFHVIRLIRVRIGGLTLGSLPAGQYCEFSKAEITSLIEPAVSRQRRKGRDEDE